MATLATDNRQRLFAVEALKLHKFLVFAVVIDGRDQDLHCHGYYDEYALDPSLCRVDAHTWDDADDGKDCHEHKDAIYRIFDRVPELHFLGTWFLIFAVPNESIISYTVSEESYLLGRSSNKVTRIAHDASVSIRVSLVKDALHAPKLS